MRRFIEEGWVSFEKSVVPEGAGAGQRHAMRSAFYAGAMWFLKTMNEQVTDDPEVTPGDVTVIMALDLELRAYRKTVYEPAEAARARKE